MEFTNRANTNSSLLQNISRNDFIRYLYQEGIRHGINNHPEFYNQIINFIKSPIGKETFEKFQSIDSSKFGINIKHILHNFME